MTATEQYFLVVLFIMLYLDSWLYKVVLSFPSVDEVFRCHRLTEYTDSYWVVLSVVSAVYDALPGITNIWVYGWNPQLLSSNFLQRCFFSFVQTTIFSLFFFFSLSLTYDKSLPTNCNCSGNFLMLTIPYLNNNKCGPYTYRLLQKFPYLHPLGWKPATPTITDRLTITSCSAWLQ